MMHEQNDSYGFLKNQQQCFIYNGYSKKVSKLVEKDRLKYKKLFIIDDASAELLKNLDNTFVKIAITIPPRFPLSKNNLVSSS